MGGSADRPVADIAATSHGQTSNVLWSEWAIESGLGGGTDLSDTRGQVRLPPASQYADASPEFHVTLHPGTRLRGPPFFVYGERYDDPDVPDDNPARPDRSTSSSRTAEIQTVSMARCCWMARAPGARAIPVRPGLLRRADRLSPNRSRVGPDLNFDRRPLRHGDRVGIPPVAGGSSTHWRPRCIAPNFGDTQSTYLRRLMPGTRCVCCVER